jgi:hypothetical protein
MTDPGATLGPDPDDPRPWEQPGAVRRDVEPHRGRPLLVFGSVALLYAVAAQPGAAFCCVLLPP